MPEAAIFDVDGTPIAPVAPHPRAWRDESRGHGHEVGFEDTRGRIGEGDDRPTPVFSGEEKLEGGGEGLDGHRGRTLEERHLPRVTAPSMAREPFERPRADGERIVFASSAEADESEECRGVVRIEGSIAAETSPADARESKPYPDIFRAALERRGGVASDDVVAVGDTPHDAGAAGEADPRTVGPLCGGFPERSPRDAGCIAIYRALVGPPARYDRSPLAGAHSP